MRTIPTKKFYPAENPPRHTLKIVNGGGFIPEYAPLPHLQMPRCDSCLNHSTEQMHGFCTVITNEPSKFVANVHRVDLPPVIQALEHAYGSSKRRDCPKDGQKWSYRSKIHPSEQFVQRLSSTLPEQYTSKLYFVRRLEEVDKQVLRMSFEGIRNASIGRQSLDNLKAHLAYQKFKKEGLMGWYGCQRSMRKNRRTKAQILNDNAELLDALSRPRIGRRFLGSLMPVEERYSNICMLRYCFIERDRAIPLKLLEKFQRKVKRAERCGLKTTLTYDEENVEAEPIVLTTEQQQEDDMALQRMLRSQMGGK